MAKIVSKKKVIVQKTAPKPVEKETPKNLSVEDMRQIETSCHEVNNAKLRMAVEEQALKNKLLEMENLNFHILKQRGILDRAASDFESKKVKQAALFKDIKTRYNIASDEFGYNPMTGELK